MKRIEFPRSIVESVLIKCRRHCCICDAWCGQKIEIHHIDSPSDNSEDNAIPVCFNCHAEISSYNSAHPKGRKFTTNEQKRLRDKTYQKYSFDIPSLPKGLTDYGRGFHDGVEWSERLINIKDIWRYISHHGDFAIEILTYFKNDDTHSMMDETLFAEVDTGIGISQSEGSSSAWSSGQVLGLWGVNGNYEVLFLTNKGKLFRELIFKTPELNSRFEQLKSFWENYEWGKHNRKPEISKHNKPIDFPPGIMNWLQTKINQLTRIDSKKELYVILRVSVEKLELRNIQTGEIFKFSSTEINDAELDQNTNELVLKLN